MITWQVIDNPIAYSVPEYVEFPVCDRESWEFWEQWMYEGTFWRGGSIRTSVISGVEHALWDIKGKSLGMPVNHLVGGPMREQVKVYTHFGVLRGIIIHEVY